MSAKHAFAPLSRLLARFGPGRLVHGECYLGVFEVVLIVLVVSVAIGAGHMIWGAKKIPTYHKCSGGEGGVWNCKVEAPKIDRDQLKKVDKLVLSFTVGIAKHKWNDLNWDCEEISGENNKTLTCKKGEEGEGSDLTKAGMTVQVQEGWPPDPPPVEYRKDGWYRPDDKQPLKEKTDPSVQHDLCDGAACVYSLPLGGSAVHEWQSDIEGGRPLGISTVFYGPGWQVTTGLPEGTTVGGARGTADVLCDTYQDTFADATSVSEPEPSLARSTDWETSCDLQGRLEEYLNAALPDWAASGRVARYRTDFEGVWLFDTAFFPLPEPASTSTVVLHPDWAPSGTVVALNVSVNPSAPSTLLLCADTPTSELSTLTAPAILNPSSPGYYIVWFTYVSEVSPFPDYMGEVVDWDIGYFCYHLGGSPTPGSDDDEDCLPEGAESSFDDGHIDRDGDGLVDGIEVAWGSSPDVADTDGDGLDDYVEMMLLTDPTDGDTDMDGVSDSDDNCPVTANPDQTNTDLDPATEHGNGDLLGDACDPDDDGDFLSDMAEQSFEYDPIARQCDNDRDVFDSGEGFYSTAYGTALDPTNPDTDGDGVLDGRECQFGSNPADASSTPARARASSGDPDGDKDGLVEGLGLLGRAEEKFLRTKDISGHNPVDPDGDTLTGDADPDSDNDGLSDGCEALITGTSPINTDTDDDGTGDEWESRASLCGTDLDDLDDDGVTNDVDTCLTQPNAGGAQTTNTDAKIGNGKGVGGDDGTVPFEDNIPDACDGDRDNDLIGNALTGIAPCSADDGIAGVDVTYDDNNDGTWKGAGDDGPSWDEDADGIIDGWEANCYGGQTIMQDRYLNTDGADADAVNDTDDDDDGLLDTWEVKKWGTNPLLWNSVTLKADTDGDGLGDCVEAADVNGDGIVDFVGDTIFYAKAALLPDATFGKDGDFDINGDAVIDFVGDVIQEAKFALISGLCK